MADEVDEVSYQDRPNISLDMDVVATAVGVANGVEDAIDAGGAKWDSPDAAFVGWITVGRDRPTHAEGLQGLELRVAGDRLIVRAYDLIGGFRTETRSLDSLHSTIVEWLRRFSPASQQLDLEALSVPETIHPPLVEGAADLVDGSGVGQAPMDDEPNDEPTKKELIEFLRSGQIEEFNRRRPVGVVDLSGADLRDEDLRGADLGGADLRGADLGGADLRDAVLGGAGLGGADLGGADLRDAVLSWANLSEANLIRANLIGADLTRTHIMVSDSSEMGFRWDGSTIFDFDDDPFDAEDLVADEAGYKPVEDHQVLIVGGTSEMVNQAAELIDDSSFVAVVAENADPSDYAWVVTLSGSGRLPDGKKFLVSDPSGTGRLGTLRFRLGHLASIEIVQGLGAQLFDPSLKDAIRQALWTFADVLRGSDVERDPDGPAFGVIIDVTNADGVVFEELLPISWLGSGARNYLVTDELAAPPHEGNLGELHYYPTEFGLSTEWFGRLVQPGIHEFVSVESLVRELDRRIRLAEDLPFISDAPIESSVDFEDNIVELHPEFELPSRVGSLKWEDEPELYGSTEGLLDLIGRHIDDLEALGEDATAARASRDSLIALRHHPAPNPIMLELATAEILKLVGPPTSAEQLVEHGVEPDAALAAAAALNRAEHSALELGSPHAEDDAQVMSGIVESIISAAGLLDLDPKVEKDRGDRIEPKRLALGRWFERPLTVKETTGLRFLYRRGSRAVRALMDFAINLFT